MLFWGSKLKCHILENYDYECSYSRTTYIWLLKRFHTCFGAIEGNVNLWSLRKIEMMGMAKFLWFFSLNANFHEFWKPKKLASTHIQYKDSFNSNQSQTNLPLTISYFLTHYIGICVMTLLVPTLERRKNHILGFGWKFVPTLVGNSCILHGEYKSLVGNGWFYHTLV